MITFTPNAIRWFLSQQPQPQQILTFTLEKAGCAGFEYAISWQPPSENFSLAGTLPYFVDPRYTEEYASLEIDVLKQNLGTQVIYKNLNVIDYCGCGLSMSFKPTVS